MLCLLFVPCMSPLLTALGVWRGPSHFTLRRAFCLPAASSARVPAAARRSSATTARPQKVACCTIIVAIPSYCSSGPRAEYAPIPSHRHKSAPSEHVTTMTSSARASAGRADNRAPDISQPQPMLRLVLLQLLAHVILTHHALNAHNTHDAPNAPCILDRSHGRTTSYVYL